MYHSHLIKPSSTHSINQPALYNGNPPLMFKEGIIASFAENQYKHEYRPVKDGQNLLRHRGGLGQNNRIHRA
jgi:hypothetical protein